MYSSQFKPCGHCGTSLTAEGRDTHVCDPVRRVEFQMYMLRHEIACFGTQVREFLEGKEGRFEAWLAARDVRRSA